MRMLSLSVAVATALAGDQIARFRSLFNPFRGHAASSRRREPSYFYVTPGCGARECARRRRQIERGILRIS